MAVTVQFFNSFLDELGKGVHDLDTTDWKLMLLDNVHVTNIDTQEKRSDVEANEISGTGYTAGGAALVESWTRDDANDRALYDFDDVSFPNATITAYFGVIYRDRGGAATLDELMCVLDFGGAQSVTAAELLIKLSETPSALWALRKL